MTTLTIEKSVTLRKNRFTDIDHLFLFLLKEKLASYEDSTYEYVISGRAFSSQENDAVLKNKSQLKKYLSQLKA